MSEHQRRVLDMLAEGKISADEAERLLAALNAREQAAAAATAIVPAAPPRPAGPKPRPKYLCVRIDGDGKKGRERVNVRVPLALVRAGMKLKGLVPEHARGKVETALVRHGIESKLSDLGADELEAILESLGELAIEIDDDGTTVRIFCE